ncbi:glucose-6-phosphate isomerase [Sphingobium fontiphilum]|uniref:Glucose-6-phosphate isomerase n=1 Tax=Sphingobium fontiphilum TaxID=944425 RepID=A0A7W6DDN5_9SPHN|nr:glucose-6-phosphate isomerase [Sphingobium fontiphilum]MBB3980797.1 glucose-6-phosphate isomerase [Sphingobium fontiphilum]
MTKTALDELREVKQIDLRSVFTTDPDRLSRYVLTQGPIRFDWSKTHLSETVMDGFVDLAEERNVAGWRDAMFAGDAVNVSEGRAAEHGAERGEGAADSVARARMLHGRMRALVDAIEAEALGPVRHILHIGIGGSALGPDLLIDALGGSGALYDVAVVSNVDGVALERAMDRFDPGATIIVVASKTFTTTETLLNAASAVNWLVEGGVDDPFGRIVALTADPDRAMEWGVDETRILPFSESVGGRYSLWSSVGFAAALALGWDDFETMLEGAAAMDRHFRLAPPRANAPMIAAFVDQYYARVRQCQTRAVFAYDERLRLLPAYLQQLEMESNGKGVTRDGVPVEGPTAPITWGGVGTDAQHAVFQLLHQGTILSPVEFIASVEPGHALDPAHHRALLTSCFAQGAALLRGRDNADDPARAYPGNRPSTTILLDDVTPESLGALIAFYEHRTFVNAVLMEVNPFDQFGVELGKEIARSIAEEGPKGFDPSTMALIERAFGGM